MLCSPLTFLTSSALVCFLRLRMPGEKGTSRWHEIWQESAKRQSRLLESGRQEGAESTAKWLRRPTYPPPQRSQRCRRPASPPSHARLDQPGEHRNPEVPEPRALALRLRRQLPNDPLLLPRQRSQMPPRIPERLERPKIKAPHTRCGLLRHQILLQRLHAHQEEDRRQRIQHRRDHQGRLKRLGFRALAERLRRLWQSLQQRALA